MFRIIFSWRLIATFLLGISSGIPLLAIGSTLQAWMTDVDVDLKVIGAFSLVGTPYTLKFLWAPLMDRFVPPLFGRRRGWMLITQICLILSFIFLSTLDPSKSTELVAFTAVLIAFFSASQDIVIDAYRRDILPDKELGLGSSYAVNGYRVGILISGAVALSLADQIPWNQVYLIIAASFLIGIVTAIFAPNPDGQVTPPRSLKSAVIEPFVEFFRRRGALEVLAFILLYKVGDSMASQMTTPFILQMGFTKTDIGLIAKSLGLAAVLIGGTVGGLIILRAGLIRSLIVFGIFQALSTLAFALLIPMQGLQIEGMYEGGHGFLDPLLDPSRQMLAFVMVLENFTSGMGTAAFVGFMASLTNKKFSATQYALLSGFMGIPRAILAAPTGWMAETYGWQNFFIICTLVAIPGLLLLRRARSWQEN